MPSAKCPVCGCEQFYCKNPEDEFDITAFSVVDGKALPSEPDAGAGAHDLAPDTEAHCDRCSWHAPLENVIKR